MVAKENADGSAEAAGATDAPSQHCYSDPARCSPPRLGASRALLYAHAQQLPASPGGMHMTQIVFNRRTLLAAGGLVMAGGVSGLLLPARAEGLAPTQTMTGGANNYRKGAAIVERIGKG